MPTTKGLFTTNRAYTALLRNTWVSTQYNVPVYQTDPYFMYNTILLSGDTFNTLAFNSDASVNNYNVTITGNVSASRLTPYGNNWSNYFDGTGDYLSIAHNASLSWISTVDGSVEAWVYMNSFAGSPTIISKSDISNSSYPNFNVAFNTNGNLLGFVGNSGSPGSALATVTSATTVPLNTWTHVAFTRRYVGGGAQNEYRVFINGVLQGSTTAANPTDARAEVFAIGATTSGTVSPTNGYISNLRFLNNSIPPAYQTTSTTNGTQIFTPSTAALTAISGTSLLTCQSNRFKDNSSNNFTITQAGDTVVSKHNPFDTGSSYSNYGSGAFFTGQTNYATFPAEVLAGDFTIEAWIYYTATSSYGTIVSTNTSSLELLITSGGAGVYYTGGSIRITTSLAFNKNSWNHIALVRNGGVAKIYMNGVVDAATYSSTASIGAAGEFYYIARDPGGSSGYTGYYSDIRVIKGTAVYTGNFTPSIAPLTTIGHTSAASYSNIANVNMTFLAANTSVLTMQYKQPHTNSTFLDYSNYNMYPITRAGNSTQGSFSPYGVRWSNYFDGTGDYLTAPSDAAFTLGTGDFTVECWVYPTAAYAVAPGNAIGGNYIAGAGNDGTYWHMSISATGTVYIGGRFTTLIASTGTVSLNTWTHIAISRQSGTSRAFINGTLSGTSATVMDFSATSTMYVGAVAPSAGFANWNGYLSNFRVVKGVGVYTGNFTLPSAPLFASGNSTIYSNTANVNITFPQANTSLLTSQSGRFIDNSPNNFTITKNGDVSVQKFSPFLPTANASPTTTGGSAYFDGTGDYISIPSNAVFQFGAGNFTIECWFYDTGTSDSYPGLISSANGWQAGSTALRFNNLANRKFGFFHNPTGDPIFSSTNTFVSYQWHHVAVARSGTSLKMFVNGVLEGAATVSASISLDTTTGVFIGSGFDASSKIKGYISDVRIVKGTAVYTDNFTPPTAPLQLAANSAIYPNTANVNVTFAAANTSLLMNFTDAAITDATTLVTLETSGDAKISTANSKFGGSSMYFDGTGDYLNMPSSPSTNFAGVDWTIETWVYISSNPAQDSTNFIQSQTGTNNWIAYLGIGLNTARTIVCSINAVGYTTTQTISLNTWAHLALVRSGGVVKLYINGTASSISVTSDIVNSSLSFWIGKVDNSPGGGSYIYSHNGFLSDLRITKGIARYTSNVTLSANAAPLR